MDKQIKTITIRHRSEVVEELKRAIGLLSEHHVYFREVYGSKFRQFPVLDGGFMKHSEGATQ